jgi:amidase
VREIDGQPMADYLEWMTSCWIITVTGHPAISVPCGFSLEGLPIGMQIVGRYRDDFGVLQLAYAFQQATQFWKRAPQLAT